MLFDGVHNLYTPKDTHSQSHIHIHTQSHNHTHGSRTHRYTRAYIDTHTHTNSCPTPLGLDMVNAVHNNKTYEDPHTRGSQLFPSVPLSGTLLRISRIELTMFRDLADQGGLATLIGGPDPSGPNPPSAPPHPAIAVSAYCFLFASW